MYDLLWMSMKLLLKVYVFIALIQISKEIDMEIFEEALEGQFFMYRKYFK